MALRVEVREEGEGERLRALPADQRGAAQGLPPAGPSRLASACVLPVRRGLGERDGVSSQESS